ncbi:U3 small nucleolar RNA-associated protein 13 [Lunasporangiospora selenospora]|uniref:U3 small nucleolar RNA-associated protein 13 n=1 Tax=Lunasporangiospora selenospora TaxID=979761 RepID=A0A9P6KIV1_9FUNG|nr:U3 small nucleolar RNA-associated protein 13 [Lunasporangiospora selenospora]
MAQQGKIHLKTSFKSTQTIESIYTGGKVCISQDEQFLITTVGEDIDVLEIKTGKKVWRLKGDTEIITTFAVTPDGRTLVSASRSLHLKFWDLRTGTLTKSMKAHEAPIIVMAIDPTSSLVATGSADSTVKVWDIAGGFCTHNFKGHGGVISAVLFHPDQSKWWLCSGADDCTVRIWDLKKRKAVAVFESHVSVIRGLAVTNSGNTLISGSRDKVVNVWDLTKLKLATTYPIYETLETVGILQKNKFTSIGDVDVTDKELFYTAGDSGVIRIWDLQSGALVAKQKEEQGSKAGISDVLYNVESQQLVSVTSDQNILFFDIERGLKRVKQVVGYNDEIIDVAYIGDETHLAVAANSEQIRIFNLKEFECDLIYGHSDTVICLDRNSDGTLLASGSKDNTAKVWSIDVENEDPDQRYKCIGTCVGHTEAIGAVALTRKTDGVMLTGSQDRTIKCWDLSTADLDEPDERHKFKSHYTIQAHEKDINSIAIAPNDKMFATGSQDKLAKIWNLQDGTLLGTCKGHKRGVWSVKFSPVDQCLATSSGDRTIKIWSLNDYSCLRTFEGHTNSILKVDFLTSGLQLVSSGSDGLVKLWTIRTNECVTTLDNHTEKIWAMTVRKDENMVVTGGADSMINLWEDFTEVEYAEKKQAQADMVLKEQELSNYLQRKDWKNAIALALSLEQPYKLLQLFNQIMRDRPEHDVSLTGLEAVDNVLRGLSLEQLAKLLGYVRDWNTHGKNMRPAQTVLYAILKQRKVQEMNEVPGIKEILDSLLPYTERHFQRVETLSMKSYVVDYTVQAMDMMALMGDLDGLDLEDEDEDGRSQKKLEEERHAKEMQDALAASRAEVPTMQTSSAAVVMADDEMDEDEDEDGHEDGEDKEDEDDENEEEGDGESPEDSDEDME